VKRAYVYQWDSEWVRQGSGSDYNDHVKENDGHNGVKLACDKDELGFVIDETAGTGDRLVAVSTDVDQKGFENSWAFENEPETDLDDITDFGTIPEFTSLLMPIASVMLIVGYNYRSRRNSLI
jgi:hypothetical protein